MKKRGKFFCGIVIITVFFLMIIFSLERIESFGNPPYITKFEACFFHKSKLACFLELNDLSINSSCFINDALLKSKIRKGLPEWAMQQIKEDLSKFQNITKADLERYFRENREINNIIARIQVKNKTVKMTYATPDFNERYSVSHKHAGNVIRYVMEYLVAKNYISDTDFIISLADFYTPISNEIVPIFTFAKNLDIPVEKDLILIPDWQNLGSTPDLRNRIRKANKLIAWENKKNMLFWRGGEFDSTGFRQKFISFAKKNPELMNAEFTKTYGVKKESNFTTLEDHLNYKYLISIDGFRCSWERLVWHLHSNSLVFKNKSNQVQWFYKGIKPFVDYIPITDENSILNSIAWAELHPKEVQSIIQNSSNFVEKNLSLEDMYHYMIVLLGEYNKKMVK